MTDMTAETAAKKPTKSQVKRSFYTLNEFANEVNLAVNDLLDLGINKKIQISFIAEGWTIYHGRKKMVPIHYKGSDNVSESTPAGKENSCNGAGNIDEIEEINGEMMVEGIESDELVKGLLPLRPEYVWDILAKGESEVKYIYLDEDKGKFSKTTESGNDDVPRVTREQLIITSESAERYKKNLPPKQDSVSSPKDSDTNLRIVGALVSLYAQVNSIKNTSYGSVLAPTIDTIAKDIVALLSSGHIEPPHGLKVTNLNSKLKSGFDLIKGHLESVEKLKAEKEQQQK